MKYLTDALGLPNKALLKRGSRSKIFFNEAGELRKEISSLKII
jgi:hypothetical protein